MRYATVIVSVLILIAVLIPGQNLPDVNIGGYDKLIHVMMFMAWAVAVRWDFGEKSFPLLRFLIVGILFSGFTEALQILVEGRSFDSYDMAADAVGLTVGLLISRPVIRLIRSLGFRR